MGGRGGQSGIKGGSDGSREIKALGAKRDAQGRAQKYRSSWVVRCMGQKEVGAAEGG